VDLDWPLSDAAVRALGLLEREPEAGHLLRGRLRGLRSLRVGTYRIIYEVDEDQRRVRVLAVRHRSVREGP
ncbi:MAG: type II toxin-antitoxin system RelE/ParE family toxin, partial [Actinomycetota bacterium]|nr:type II toxin-antitoxin system RelE/ParE family toxin [Actinomycetota bacterium]